MMVLTKHRVVEIYKDSKSPQMTQMTGDPISLPVKGLPANALPKLLGLLNHILCRLSSSLSREARVGVCRLSPEAKLFSASEGDVAESSVADEAKGADCALIARSGEASGRRGEAPDADAAAEAPLCSTSVVERPVTPASVDAATLSPTEVRKSRRDRYYKIACCIDPEIFDKISTGRIDNAGHPNSAIIAIEQRAEGRQCTAL